jgi:putative DNA-invertase from lambdoid prophage Rac
MRIGYFRVSTSDQSIEAQRHAMGGIFDREFADEGVSGGILAKDRPGFAKLLDVIRRGDELHVYAVDRLGRDAIDIQTTVRDLIDAGVILNIHSVGVIAGDAGKIILAVLAQVADLERRKIRERTEMGRQAARASLAATGLTHNGKLSLGRPRAFDAYTVELWRRNNNASIRQTAEHFGISPATVKRYATLGPRRASREPVADS